MGAMDFLGTPEGQLFIAVAVGLVGVGAAYFLLSSKKPKVCLDADNFKEFKLGKDSQGEDVIKPYTPTTLDSDVGYFELVIKMYPQGRMSHHFRDMHEGDYLAIKGPKVAREVLENPSDKTKVHLIYANVMLEDILLKDELDNLARTYPDTFKIYYVLNQPPEIWEGGVGFVSKEMIQAHLPPPASDIQMLRCGPPPMNKAMAAHLDALGYASETQSTGQSHSVAFGVLPSSRIFRFPENWNLDESVSERANWDKNSVKCGANAPMLMGFHHRILADFGRSAVRVHNSSEADVVFVPFFASLCYNRFSKVRLGQKRSTNVVLQEKLVKFLVAQNEWKRSGGKDHIIVAHHPNSLLDARLKLWPAIFILSDFGRSYFKLLLYASLQRNVFKKTRMAATLFGICLINKGGTIRQELYYMLKNETDAHFTFGTYQKDGARQTSKGMRTSKFCLNIAGDTPSSNRPFDAIPSHCVPVIISDEIELPNEDVLDYSKFCVFVGCSSDALRML
ncbi:hypothetical protein SASPL_125832 [Salvia splendens]|uniref:Xylogalacturonan beta-1,3-xylosyltransferase n=1 Tax=Salvia splendens TaxID=180675 RepID=A0A8X8XEI1_SALSN|nr:hypothetical protein SASPL_125832 [Salvia splendens]